MIRFSQLPSISEGIPYANSDFSSVLQEEHLKSYKAFLDAINYGSIDPAEPNNSGIILNGCDVFRWAPLGTPGARWEIGVRDAVVYIDGEFYTRNPAHTATASLNTLTNANFYISAGTTQSRTRLTRDFITPGTASILRYFEVDHDGSGGGGVPNGQYIKFSEGGSSRYFRRILKYFLSRPGDIYQTTSLRSFKPNGKGFNDMEGFVLLDGTNHPTNTSGKFLRGWNIGETSPPEKDLGGIGGSSSHRLIRQEMGNHNHIATTTYFKNSTVLGEFYSGDEVPADFSHYHYMNLTDHFWPSNNSTTLPISTSQNPDSQVRLLLDGAGSGFEGNTAFPAATINTGSMFAAVPFDPNQPPNTEADNLDHSFWTGGVHDYENSELGTHKHSIPYDFGDPNNINEPGAPHENRPPYMTVAFYTKKLN